MIRQRFHRPLATRPMIYFKYISSSQHKTETQFLVCQQYSSANEETQTTIFPRR